MNRTRLFPVILAGTLLLGVSAQAGVYTATLTGAQEVGPTGSPATGSVTVTVLADTMTVDLSFSGLTGGVASAAHIHCCVPVGTNAGVAVGFTGFPAATSGTYSHVFNLLDPAIYSGTFLTASGGTAAGAEAALITGLNGLMAYSNIHDATFPGGEIRGNLVPTPEPSTALLLMAGMLGGAGLVRRTQKRRRSVY